MVKRVRPRPRRRRGGCEGDNPLVDRRQPGVRRRRVGRVAAWSARLWPPAAARLSGLRSGRPPRRTRRATAADAPAIMGSVHDVALPTDLADDPVFALHVGGKMAIALDPVARLEPRRPVAGLHPRRRPGVRGDRRRPGAGAPTTPGCPTSSRSSPTAPPCSAWATSARRAAMPVMEGKAVLFKQFGGVDAVPICLDTTDVDEIVETVAGSRRPSAASTSRTSPRRAASRSSGGSGAARHPGLPRRPARHGGRRARRAAQRRRG